MFTVLHCTYITFQNNRPVYNLTGTDELPQLFISLLNVIAINIPQQAWSLFPLLLSLILSISVCFHEKWNTYDFKYNIANMISCGISLLMSITPCWLRLNILQSDGLRLNAALPFTTGMTLCRLLNHTYLNVFMYTHHRDNSFLFGLCEN